MNHCFPKTSAALLCLLSAWIMISCVRENTEDCISYSLKVRAVDVQGNDLTDSKTLQKVDVYLFDESGFVRMVPTGSSSDYLFGETNDKKLTLVAWGNLKEDTLITTTIAPGTSLEAAKVQLKQQTAGAHIPVTDLFYSRKELNRPQTRSIEEQSVVLTMERMVAGICIRTRHLSDRFVYDGNPFILVVKGTGTEVDFTGKISGGDADYRPYSIMDNNGDLYVPTFHIFPIEEDNHFIIQLYRSDELLCTLAEDNDFQPFEATAGKQTNIDLDFRYPEVKIIITIAPWGETNQDVEM